ncbi:MAG: FUSC family protein, partial [Bacillota bacterium]
TANRNLLPLAEAGLPRRWYPGEQVMNKMIPIGPRLWKTGLAVALTLFLIRLTDHPYEVYGAVAAALAVAPSASRSLRSMTAQISAHLIGGLVGSLAILLFGPNPLVIGGAVILVLLLCQRFGWKELAAPTVTVALFVMAPHADSVTAYSLWRLLSVLTGSVVGALVNAFILPPDYQGATLQAMERAGAALDRFMLDLTHRLPRPHAITKAEILAGAAKVEAEIGEARRLHLLMSESQRGQAGQREVIERAIKVLASLLERIQVLHKAALVAERAAEYPVQLPEIQAALTDLVAHRKALYTMLLVPDPHRTLPGALAELEHRFESPGGLPASPEEVEPFFRLYRMRSSVSYMANRLGRLYVAKEAALPPVLADTELGDRVLVS